MSIQAQPRASTKCQALHHPNQVVMFFLGKCDCSVGLHKLYKSKPKEEIFPKKKTKKRNSSDFISLTLWVKLY